MQGVSTGLSFPGLGAAVACIRKCSGAGLENEGATHDLSHCPVDCPAATKVPELYKADLVLRDRTRQKERRLTRMFAARCMRHVSKEALSLGMDRMVVCSLTLKMWRRKLRIHASQKAASLMRLPVCSAS